MSKVIRRLLRLLFTLGVYNKHFVITYTGEVSSMNKIWSSPHWGTRSGIKNKYSKIFSTLMLEEEVKPMQEMVIVLFYQSRVDVDNAIVGCKILADSIKGSYLPDDSNKFYKGLFMIHDPALAKNTYEYHLVGK
jgi:hypothetical protein